MMKMERRKKKVAMLVVNKYRTEGDNGDFDNKDRTEGESSDSGRNNKDRTAGENTGIIENDEILYSREEMGL